MRRQHISRLMLQTAVNNANVDVLKKGRRCNIFFPVRHLLVLTSILSALVLRLLNSVHTYSRVHKSSDSFFSKILEKPSIVQKKMILHIKGLDFSQR